MSSTLTIRGIDDDLKAQLRVQAARNGRSMEAEVRAILTSHVSAGRPARRLGSFIHEQFADLDVDELPVPLRTDPARGATL